MTEPPSQLAPVASLASAPEERPWQAALLLAVAIPLLLGWLVDFSGRISNWHWPRSPGFPLTFTGELLLALPAAVLVGWLAPRRTRTALVLGALLLRVALDIVLLPQWDLRQRLLYHVEAVPMELGGIIRDYAAETEKAFLPFFVQTKPPGLMIFHDLLYSAALAVVPNDTDAFQLTVLATYCLQTAMLAALLLLLLRAAGEMSPGANPSILLPAALVAFAPQTQVMQLEFSIRLFPMLAFGLWFLGRRGLGWRRGAAAGILWGAGVFVDWSVLLMALIPAAQIFLSRDPRRIAAAGGAFLAGAVAVWGTVLLLTDNDYLALFRLALEAHGNLYGLTEMPLWRRWFYIPFLVFELTLVAGWPLLVLAGRGALRLRRSDAAFLLPLGIYAAAVLLNGNVASESARLWAVLVPPAALLAARSGANAATATLAVTGQAALAAGFAGLRWFFWTG